MHKEADFTRTDLAEHGADGKGFMTTPVELKYKPMYSMEFNRDGERQLYYCNTVKAYPLMRSKELKYSIAGLLACFTGLYNPFFILHWTTTIKL